MPYALLIPQRHSSESTRTTVSMPPPEVAKSLSTSLSAGGSSNCNSRCAVREVVTRTSPAAETNALEPVVP